MVYLDWAATSPPEPEILAEAARVAAQAFGNPSSRHALGASAKAKLEEARERLAAAILGLTSGLATGPISAQPAAHRGSSSPRSSAMPRSSASGRLIFTSGGTEADDIPLLALLRSALNARRDGSIKRLHMVTTEIEHAAIYEQALLLKSLGIGVSFVAPEADGRVDPCKVGDAVEKDTALVAVMAVNNETGAIQPLLEISAAISAAATSFGRQAPRLHVDAVQALGKVAFDPIAVGAGSAAFSAHKLQGPRGVGALWVDGALFEPLAVGGGQEWAQRPGTENLQGSWAFAAAAEAARDSFAQRADRARALEARLLAGLAAIPGALALPLGRRPGDPKYSPYIVSAAFPGLTGEVLVRALSDTGIAVSTGSACSSNSRKAGRRVMLAMGLGEGLGLSSIRISTGALSVEADVDAFLEAAAGAYRKLKA